MIWKKSGVNGLSKDTSWLTWNYNQTFTQGKSNNAAFALIQLMRSVSTCGKTAGMQSLAIFASTSRKWQLSKKTQPINIFLATSVNTIHVSYARRKTTNMYKWLTTKRSEIQIEKTDSFVTDWKPILILNLLNLYSLTNNSQPFLWFHIKPLFLLIGLFIYFCLFILSLWTIDVSCDDSVSFIEVVANACWAEIWSLLFA